MYVYIMYAWYTHQNRKQTQKPLALKVTHGSISTQTSAAEPRFDWLLPGSNKRLSTKIWKIETLLTKQKTME